MSLGSNRDQTSGRPSAAYGFLHQGSGLRSRWLGTWRFSNGRDRPDPKPDVMNRHAGNTPPQRFQQHGLLKRRQFLEQGGVGDSHVQNAPTNSPHPGVPAARFTERLIPRLFQLTRRTKPPVSPGSKDLAQHFGKQSWPTVSRARHGGVHPPAEPEFTIVRDVNAFSLYSSASLPATLPGRFAAGCYRSRVRGITTYV